MIIRPFVLAMSFVFLTAGFSPALCQESPEEKANRLLAQIYSLPNLPKLSPVKVQIDQSKKQSHGRYLRRPKRFFGLKTSKVAEIHLSAKYVEFNSDDAVLVTLAHELGHHFSTADIFELSFNPDQPLNRLLRERKNLEENQYFAEAFALYVLGEELYKKGRLDLSLTHIKNQDGAYWLYTETNPLLYKYHRDLAELWVNYWFEGARSRLDEVVKKVGF